MKLSNRINGITANGSDGWDLFHKARRMVQAGYDVTELTIGEHDIRTDRKIIDAMHASAKGGHTGYAMVPGTDALRDAVAERITNRTGVPTTRDNIIITAGGQAALFATHHAICDEGSRALYIDPYYATYPGSIRSVGAVPVPVRAHADRHFQPAVSDLMAAAEGATSLLINSPNNPTGVVYSQTTMDGIAQVSRDHDLWLISDEVYDTQIWNGQHISPRALPDMANRTLVVGSMSKSHAMTGSRIGWVCGPEAVIERLVSLATNTTYGVAGFVQDAALFALELGSEHEAKVAAPFERRRAIVLKALEDQNAVKAVPADGAMYVMLDIRNTGMTGEDFAEALLDSHNIAVMPGESFGSAAAGHIRVAMTVDDTRFEAALKTLVAFAKTKTS